MKEPKKEVAGVRGNSGGGARINPPHRHSVLSVGGLLYVIVAQIKKGKSIREISRGIGKHHSTVQAHLLILKDNKIIAKNMHNKYYVTFEGNEQFESAKIGGLALTGCEKVAGAWYNQDRAHNIKIKVLITHKPYELPFDWKTHKGLKNQTFYIKTKDGVLVTYTGQSIIFQLPTMYGEDVDIIMSEAGEKVKKLCVSLTQELQGLQVGTQKVYAQVIQQHHAVPNEPMAKYATKNNLSYQSEILHIDNSTGRAPELEFVDTSKSPEHLNRYVKHVEDFVTKDLPTLSEFKEMVKVMQSELIQTQQQIGFLVQSQRVATEQIKALVPKPLQQDDTDKVEYIR